MDHPLKYQPMNSVCVSVNNHEPIPEMKEIGHVHGAFQSKVHERGSQKSFERSVNNAPKCLFII